MTVKIPPIATLISALGGLGGVAGTIIGLIGPGGLPTSLRITLVAVAGLLVNVSHWHATARVREVTPRPSVAPAKAPAAPAA